MTSFHQYKDLDATRALVSLPMKSIYREPSGIQLLPDGDMENVAVVGWSGYNATFSKETVNPHSGTRCLRINWAGAGMLGRVNFGLVVGKIYRASGWARSGDGISTPALADWGANIILWTGTNSTNWQYFDVTYTNPSIGIGFGGPSAAGRYIEVDDVIVEAVLHKTPNIGTLGGGALLGADGFTPASMPTLIPDIGMKFNGSTQNLVLPDNAALSFTAGGGVDLPFSLEFFGRSNLSAPSTIPFISKGEYATTMEYALYIFSDGNVTFSVGHPNLAAFIARTRALGTAILYDGAPHHWLATYDGSKVHTGMSIYLDGVRIDNAGVLFGVYAGMTAGAGKVRIGNYSGIGFFAGTSYDSKIWPVCLTPSQVKFRAGRALAEMRIR